MRSETHSVSCLPIRLHARVFRYRAASPNSRWYVDVDDMDDQQPDDPIWFGYFETHSAAVEAACEKIASLKSGQAADRPASRVSGRGSGQPTWPSGAQGSPQVRSLDEAA